MDNAQTKGRWCKLTDAAQLLGVSEITVRRKAKSGQLKTILRNGKYMVFLEENTELGLFMGSSDQPVSPTLSMSSERRAQFSSLNRATELKPQIQKPNEEVIQSLKRTIEDQQTLIASLEDSIARMRAKLLGEKNSSR
ncbi:MAG: hypothetical protein FJY29_11540 [Betaproteobacteria bacterium]|nr:hypothetical protein [Betaproteobacteria bacterium]